MMDIPMIDSYLESVAGYICDEDKLVTYKWLSKELEVHVNVAKVILWRYWQKHKNDVLVATFMLIGHLKDGGMRVEVVKDCDLERAREKFEKIVSEHVYSLQKSLTDVELLAGAGRGDSRYSAITCKDSVILSEDDLLKMRWGKAQPPKVASTEKKAPAQAASKKENLPAKEIPKRPETSKESEEKTEAKSEEKAKKISPTAKQKSTEKKGVSKKPVQSTKAGFGHLFAKAGNQRKPPAVSSSGSNKTENARKDSGSSPESKTPKSSADNFFGSSKAKENEDSSNVPMETETSSPEENGDKKSGAVSAKLAKEEKPAKKTKATKSKKPARGTKRGRSQDSGEDAKKRKRIIVASDSSEESAAGSADEDMFESPPPPSPKKDETPSPPPVQLQGNKRKVGKWVDKTFTDDDGYLVTKKVHVYESCSDEEPEAVVEPKKKIEPERPKETKPPAKKKQTSLMSFFKKG